MSFPTPGGGGSLGVGTPPGGGNRRKKSPGPGSADDGEPWAQVPSKALCHNFFAVFFTLECFGTLATRTVSQQISGFFAVSGTFFCALRHFPFSLFFRKFPAVC